MHQLVLFIPHPYNVGPPPSYRFVYNCLYMCVVQTLPPHDSHEFPLVHIGTLEAMMAYHFTMHKSGHVYNHLLFSLRVWLRLGIRCQFLHKFHYATSYPIHIYDSCWNTYMLAMTCHGQMTRFSSLRMGSQGRPSRNGPLCPCCNCCRRCLRWGMLTLGNHGWKSQNQMGYGWLWLLMPLEGKTRNGECYMVVFYQVV